MSECERAHEAAWLMTPSGEEHLRECSDCRDARSVHLYLRHLAAADELSPALPDARILLLKAEIMRGQSELRVERDRTRWTGVGVWAAVAVTWLVVLTWKLGEVQALLERFDLAPALPGGAMANAVLIAAVGGLVAFTVFAVAVHSVLAEM